MKKSLIIIAVLVSGIAVNSQTRYSNIQDGIENYSISKPDTTFNQNQFNEIQKQLKDANAHVIGGTILAVVGGGMFAGGIYLVNKNLNNWLSSSGSKSSNGGGIILVLLGSAGLGVGISVALVGANNSKKCKKQLNSMKSGANLTFGFTENGMGFVFML